MSPENKQVTVMILYVDLKCSCCYNKVRKLLCKFPQIRGQEFDEEKNKVRITVVCCDPERFRDKLCCKGGKAIQSIEIVENPKPESPKPKPGRKTKQEKPSSPADKQKQPELKPENPPPPPPPPPTQTACCQECYEGRGGGPCHYGYGRPVPPPPPTQTRACCQECYEGRGGGPCHYGYGRLVPLPPGPCYDGYGYCNRGPCYVTSCDCLSEENPQGCSIM